MLSEYRPLLRSKFVFLWVSQVLSQLTINIMNFLLLLLLFNATGSTIATSLLWVAYALPALLIGPIAAAIADVIDRRKILMATNFIQAFVMFGYAALGDNTHAYLAYAVALVYSFFNQFYIPSEMASIPSLVKKSDLPKANGLFFLTQQAALIVGFGVAGILKQTIGFSNTFYLGAGFLFIAYLSVFMLPKVPKRSRQGGLLIIRAFKFFERIKAGFLFIKNKNEVLVPFVLLSGLWTALTVVVVNIPAIAKDLFFVAPEVAGVVIMVPAGLGSAIGAFVIPKKLKVHRKISMVNKGFLYIALSLVAVLYIPYGMVFGLDLFLRIFMVVILGYSFVSILIPALTFLQETTPGGLQGRVFGNFWFVMTMATLLPVIFSGVISDLFGVKPLIIALILVSVFALVYSKRNYSKILKNG